MVRILNQHLFEVHQSCRKKTRSKRPETSISFYLRYGALKEHHHQILYSCNISFCDENTRWLVNMHRCLFPSRQVLSCPRHRVKNPRDVHKGLGYGLHVPATPGACVLELGLRVYCQQPCSANTSTYSFKW